MQQYGLGKGSILDIVDAAGVVRKPRQMTEEQIAEAAALYLEGWSVTKIGARLSFSPGTIWLNLKQRGVTMRQPGGAPLKASLRGRCCLSSGSIGRQAVGLEHRYFTGVCKPDVDNGYLFRDRAHESCACGYQRRPTFHSRLLPRHSGTHLHGDWLLISKWDFSNLSGTSRTSRNKDG
jgi:hypothetical protein